MREIKFKVWSKNYGDWMHIDEPLIAINSLTGELFGIVEGEYAPLNSGNYHLCQYTGLKDRNGREIWDRSILKCHDESGGEVCNHEVKLPDFYREVWSTRKTESGTRLPANEGERCDLVEVIGDIYSTPDLLKADTEEEKG